MKKPKYFNCYLDSEVLLNHLSDEQAGKLWKSLFAYVNRDEESDICDPVVSLAYEVMSQQIKRDFAKYNEKCEKNRKNGLEKKRTVATASDRKRTVATDNGREHSLTVVSVRDQEEEKEEDKKENKDKEENKDEEDSSKQAVGQAPTTSVSFINNVIDYLNHKIGTRYKADSKSTVRLINARIREGFTLSDFKKVIDNRIDAWGKDKQMRQYLRPETLFSNKFESYLNSQSLSRNYTDIFDYDEEF